LNSWISAGFPQFSGAQFNLLNANYDLYSAIINNPSILSSFPNYVDAGAGPFFTYLNGPWIDAAVAQPKPIIVLTEINLDPAVRSLWTLSRYRTLS